MLEKELAAPLQAWMQEAELALERPCDVLMQQATAAGAALLRADIEAFCQGKLASLSGSTDINELRRVQEELLAL